MTVCDTGGAVGTNVCGGGVRCDPGCVGAAVCEGTLASTDGVTVASTASGVAVAIRPGSCDAAASFEPITACAAKAPPAITTTIVASAAMSGTGDFFLSGCGTAPPFGAAFAMIARPTIRGLRYLS